MFAVFNHFFGDSDVLVSGVGVVVFPSLEENGELSFNVFGNRGGISTDEGLAH